MKRVIVFPIKVIFTLAVYGIPVLGVWLASSLAAYLNGILWLPLVAGFLLFPVLPLLWEWRASRRRKRKPSDRPRILNFFDRLTLRTFFLSLLFIGSLLAFYPQTSFLALSVRGDWMLQNQSSRPAELTRQTLFTLADRLEWLYLAVSPNPFESYIEVTEQKDDSSPSAQRPTVEIETTDQNDDQATSSQQTADQTEVVEQKDDDSASVATPSEKVEAEQQNRDTTPSPKPLTVIDVLRQNDDNSLSTPSSSPKPSPPADAYARWPWKDATLHPAISSMPQSAETSIESVAQYIAAQEPDPFLRIKALHDYVADRIAYDAASYFAEEYPDQSAQTVFTTRKAVCAGYANLLKALGDVIGEEIRIVIGNVRSSTSEGLSGEGHAWNAVNIQGNWYFVDATWDSGTIDRATGFKKSYKTTYLFTPPEIMALTHFPQDSNWQLLAPPLSRGEFLRRPMMSPQFYVENMNLVSPTRSQTDVNQTATINIQNPNQRWLLVKYQSKGTEISGSYEGSCSVTRDTLTKIDCTFPDAKIYDVYMFSAAQQYDTSYSYVGRLEFNNRS